jgi:predicted aspartyl protease
VSVHPYNTDYFPSAPFCKVYIGAGGEPPLLGPIRALLDTGADISVIPMQYLQRLTIHPIRHSTARSIWGDRRTVDIYAISLRLDNLRLRAVQVLGDAQGDEIVLGRTILNRLHIVLDGPAAVLDIVESRTV